MNNISYYISPKEQIVNYCSSTDLELVPQSNKYKNWLSNLLIKLLFKLNLVSRKEYKYTNTVEYETVTINLDDLVNYIDEYNYSLWQRFNTKPLLLVVGRDVYNKLTKLQLHNPYYLDLNMQGVDKHFLGIKLYFCPYINGCFIIPDIT